MGKMLTSASVDSLSKLVKEQQSLSSLTCLINAYRAACHSDFEATSVSGCVISHGIHKSENFSTLLMFMLHEADPIFRMLLGIPSSSSKKEAVLDLKKSAKWLSLRPLIKSYLRSTIFLLNQISDSEILAFSISRLRASIIFLTAFPSLLNKLLKVFFNFTVVKYTWDSSYAMFDRCLYRWFLIFFIFLSSSSSLDFQYYVFSVSYSWLARSIFHLEIRFLNMCINFQTSCNFSIVNFKDYISYLNRTQCFSILIKMGWWLGSHSQILLILQLPLLFNVHLRSYTFPSLLANGYNVNFTPCKIFLTLDSILLQIFVDLWATGDRSLSSHSFLIIRDIASMCSSNWLDICFVKTYKAFIDRSPSEHTHFLRNSFVELCCLDVLKSSNKAMICTRRLGDILLKGWQTKKKVSFKQL